MHYYGFKDRLTCHIFLLYFFLTEHPGFRCKNSLNEFSKYVILFPNFNVFLSLVVIFHYVILFSFASLL